MYFLNDVNIGSLALILTLSVVGVLSLSRVWCLSTILRENAKEKSINENRKK